MDVQYQKKKKISILALHLGYGGIEKSIAAVANMLCNDYDVELAVCYKLYDTPAFFIDHRVKVCYLNDDLKPNKEKFLDAVHKKNIFKSALSLNKKLCFMAVLICPKGLAFIFRISFINVFVCKLLRVKPLE